MRRVDDDVGHLAIERIAHRVELAQPLARIGHLQQRTGGVAAEAAREIVDLGVQVDDGGAGLHLGPVGRPQHAAATGGDDPLLGIGERLADHALLDFAKCRLAFAIEELTDRAAEIDLDLVVGVQKRQLAHARQLSPDRGFSTTGHAYKDDQGQVLGRAPAEMVNGTVVFRPSGDVKLIVPVPDVAVAPNL